MKILKHGNSFEELQFTCPKCGCVFVCDSPNDIHHGIEFGTTYLVPAKSYTYVKCPECREEIQAD